jgi:hypothetical protein
MHDDDDRGPTPGLVGLTSWLDRNFAKLVAMVLVIGTLAVLAAALMR